MQIVLASGNRHKFEEFKSFFRQFGIFERLGIHLLSPTRLASPGGIEETGATYEENALIKARAWAQHTGFPAIADDSGVEVRHLDWRPGIHSARAVPGTDADRTAWLLRSLENVSDRRACFVASLVVAFPGTPNGRDYFSSEGRCWGSVAHRTAGASGFGYDPVFLPDGYDRTFSELGPEIKSKISHRAIAMEGMAQMAESMIKYLNVRGHDCRGRCTTRTQGGVQQ